MGEMRPELYSRSRFRLQFRREHSFLWVLSTPRASQEAWRTVLTRPNAVKFAILTHRSSGNPAERGEAYGSITLAATMQTPTCELRPATIDRILVIEHDGALQKILRRLFSTEGYGFDVLHKVLLWKWVPTTSDPYRSKTKCTCRSSAYAHEEQVARQPGALARL